MACTSQRSKLNQIRVNNDQIYSTPTSYRALTWWLSSPLAHVPSLECLLFPLLAYSSSPWAKRREEMAEKGEKQKVSSDLSFWSSVFALLISSVNASPIISGTLCHRSFTWWSPDYTHQSQIKSAVKRHFWLWLSFAPPWNLHGNCLFKVIRWVAEREAFTKSCTRLISNSWSMTCCNHGNNGNLKASKSEVCCVHSTGKAHYSSRCFTHVTMQVISIDTLLQAGQVRDQSKAARPPRIPRLFLESDARIHIKERRGFCSLGKWEGGTHAELLRGSAWTIGS